MKIKELIRVLKGIGKEQEVYISCDSEGNSFGTIGGNSFYYDKEKVVMFPFEEHLDLEFGGE